ncbi:MAG: ABC transporter ATP-binding protein [Kiritimatiellae bacterium]|nr:ABC transporter ATP-binding protein [Kiritimatiellia bacterium]
MTPLLNIEALNVRYHGVRGHTDAVRDVSLQIGAGESVAIVGESGCGKTSIALALMGLLPPKQITMNGIIHFNNQDLLSMTTKEIRRIRGRDMAMIFQDPMTSLNPYLRIGMQIAEPLWTHTPMRHAAARKEAIQLLDSVGFDNSIRDTQTYPHQLSGGMCQRAMIASALACAPKLLIADEPTTALDVITQDQVLSLIRTKQSEHGMALLLITHDLGIVAQTCERVAVMYQGQIVETGTTKTIYENPQHDYTRALLDAVPRLDGPRVHHLRTVGKETTPKQREEKKQSIQSTQRVVLDIKNLSVHFRSGRRHMRTVKAVDHVSFALNEQEVLGLVGQSGSGKSTLIRALLQLETPTTGEVFLKDWKLKNLTQRERHKLWQQMQMVFQDPYGSLNARLTAGRIIAEPLKNFSVVPRRQTRARVEELMALVQLDPAWQNRYPHEFSGGQRQRIGIARALACNPHILFCDEPVSALDVSIQAEVLNLLRDLKEQLNLTIIFVSHDLAVVRHVADRVAVMHRGKIVEWLDADRIVASASHPYTQQLMKAVPIPDPKRYHA